MTGSPAPRQIASNGLPDELARLLLEAWVLRFTRERLSLGPDWGRSGGLATFGSVSGSYFQLRWSGLELEVEKIVAIEEDTVRSLVQDASQRVTAGDYGGSVVYIVEMAMRPLDILSEPMHVMRIWSDLVHIDGSRRLSNVVLLDFQPQLHGDPARGVLAPPCTVRATIFSPGPYPSEFTRQQAVGSAESVAAICAFATGRPVEYTPPDSSAADDDTNLARTRRNDPTILGLARDSVSLDLYGLLETAGDDTAFRVRHALFTYHAALKQVNPDIVVMMLVTTIEALISPRQEWGKKKIVQRFQKALIELCPEAIDEILGRGNLEEAFEYTKKGQVKRQRLDLLDRIYDLRSTPTHTGIGFATTENSAVTSPASMRIALISGLARAAILAFITAPRSSLIGHPSLDPPEQDPPGPEPSTDQSE